MSDKKIILTDEGLKKLEEELEYLKTIKRKEVAGKIKVALSFGDLSENSEYDEAKNEQAIVESRIAYLENMLKNVTVLDEDELTTEYVNIGCKINSEYDEAKNEQAIVESRIAYLENMLKNVTVLDEDELTTEYVNIGCKILVKDIELDELCNYQIVGSTEANPIEGRISDESPVGKALLGHKIGDIVDVETPGGVISFEVLEISK